MISLQVAAVAEGAVSTPAAMATALAVVGVAAAKDAQGAVVAVTDAGAAAVAAVAVVRTQEAGLLSGLFGGQRNSTVLITGNMRQFASKPAFAPLQKNQPVPRFSFFSIFCCERCMCFCERTRRVERTR